MRHADATLPGTRRAFTILEVVLATTILAICLTSIFGTLATSRDAYQRADVLILGRLLAQSVMEQVRHRFATSDPRFFQAGASPDTIYRGLLAGDWQRPFLALAQKRTPVLSPPGESNAYFDPASGPRLPAGPGSDAERQLLAGFSYEVGVAFDVTCQNGQPPVPIDADGDGQGETDLGRVDVQVFYDPPDQSTGPRVVTRLTTLLGIPGKPPGICALSP